MISGTKIARKKLYILSELKRHLSKQQSAAVACGACGMEAYIYAYLWMFA